METKRSERERSTNTRILKHLQTSSIRGCSHFTSAKKGIHNRGTIEEVLQKCWQNRSETQYSSRFQTDFKHCVTATGGQVQILWADLDCFKPIKTANAVQKQLSLGLGWVGPQCFKGPSFFCTYRLKYFCRKYCTCTEGINVSNTI